MARTARRLCCTSSRSRIRCAARLIVRPFQEQPARLGQERLSSLLSEGVDFGPAHLVNRIAHVLGDMKAVQDVERVPRLLGDDLQIRLPHVAADERERRGALGTEPAEKRSSVLARRC